MSEFGPDWPGWQLRTTPEQLVERIAEPAGGLALVETGVDIHPVLGVVSKEVDSKIGPTTSEKSFLWSHSRDRGIDSSNIGQVVPRTFIPIVEQAYEVTRMLSRPVDAFLKSPTPLHPIQLASLFIVAERRSQLGPTHSDFKVSTMWLGATKPALKIQYNDEWLSIGDVPAGHALMWRGYLAHNDGQKLEPIKHSARYRSVIRRIVMLT